MSQQGFEIVWLAAAIFTSIKHSARFPFLPSWKGRRREKTFPFALYPFPSLHHPLLSSATAFSASVFLSLSVVEDVIRNTIIRGEMDNFPVIYMETSRSKQSRTWENPLGAYNISSRYSFLNPFSAAGDMRD